jgi:hypothetical protein
MRIEWEFTRLDTEVSPIYVIPKEEVSCVSWAASNLEEFHKVILRVKSIKEVYLAQFSYILAVNVTTN